MDRADSQHARLIPNGTVYEAAGGNIGPEAIRGDFDEGLMAVRVGGKFGYIDVMGNMVIAPQFEKACRFIHGLASVTLAGKIFPINRTGTQVSVATTNLAMAMNSSQLE